MTGWAYLKADDNDRDIQDKDKDPSPDEGQELQKGSGDVIHNGILQAIYGGLAHGCRQHCNYNHYPHLQRLDCLALAKEQLRCQNAATCMHCVSSQRLPDA